jgi:hypothetical protein
MTQDLVNLRSLILVEQTIEVGADFWPDLVLTLEIWSLTQDLVVKK